jgi:CheY-specific phosphatase CheX
MGAAISFKGTISGDVRILLSKEIAKTMVQNMLGLEDGDIAGKDIEDCSKEAINMVCGNFLSKLYNTQLFDLSMPTFKDYQSENLESGDAICRMDFDSDSGKIGVMVKV